METLPTLYSLKPGSTRRRKWSIRVKGVNITVEHGLEDGKLQTSVNPTKASGKNSGKSNATTARNQAVLEARRMWIKKIDKGYAPDPKDVDGLKLFNTIVSKKRGNNNQNVGLDDFDSEEELVEEKHELLNILVMKGKTWASVKTRNYPYAVQPKMDGIHCLAQWNSATSKAVITSRGCKQFHESILKHVKRALTQVLKESPDMIFAGELYAHNPPDIEEGQTPLQYVQKRCSVTRKTRHEGESTIKFYMYDQVPRDPNNKISFINRFREAHRLLKLHPSGSIKSTPTKIVNSEEEVMEYYRECLERGYEGIVLKQLESPYKRDSRTADFLKLKPDKSREDTIIGGKEGEGNHKGCVIFHLEASNGIKHWCTPAAPLEQRQEWFRDIKKLIGKKCTIKYYGITADGMPIFANAMAIRDYE